MKTIKQIFKESIHEGFFNNTGAGYETTLEKRRKEVVEKIQALDDSIADKYIIINDDLSVDIKYCDVTILELDITELPVQFNEVGGSFTISGCDNLTTLKGIPIKVVGDYNIQLCKSLKQYDYQPDYVGESINIVGLKCITLDIKTKCKTLVVKKCLCSNILLNTWITNIWLENNRKLNTFGSCRCVKSLSLSNIPNIKSLQPLDLQDIENLSIDNTNIKDLKGLPKEMQSLSISDCKELKSFDGLPEMFGTELVLEKLKYITAEIPATRNSNNLFIFKCPGISISPSRKQQWNSVFIDYKRVY